MTHSVLIARNNIKMISIGPIVTILIGLQTACRHRPTAVTHNAFFFVKSFVRPNIQLQPLLY